MFFVCSTSGIRRKYDAAAGRILAAIARLGAIVDVSGLPPEQIQARIASLAPGPVCLIGGYDQIPAFSRPNPTFGEDSDDDADIPTDAPYGAQPGDAAEEYAPSRAVSRLPDSAVADVQEFLAILSYQLLAPKTPTPKGSFEEAAKEFSGALKYVRTAIPDAAGKQRLSPPDNGRMHGLTAAMSGRGRVHVLLHGANKDPDWAVLWGHGEGAHAHWIKALSTRLIDLCDLRGAIVTFSSCYAAMLDVEPAVHGKRTSKNQVALACLAHGAKVVFGATRSNWIGTRKPYDDFGPRLIAETWRQLAKGKKAAEALRLAKAAYLKVALSGPPDDHPYALKTVLQAQCYGHPGARL